MQLSGESPRQENSSLDQLNRNHGISGAIEFSQGRGGLECASLRHASGATAEIYSLGSHVTSWRNPEGQDLLFLSEQSNFETGKPIRGGIPLVFPQFSDLGELPQHGFVRNAPWQVVETAIEPVSGDLSITMAFDPSSQNLKGWPHRSFELLHKVQLGESLESQLVFVNLGLQSVSFTNAFHTYFQIGDISGVQVEGLADCHYLDQLADRAERLEQSGAIRFSEETDRIYKNVPRTLRIVDEANGRAFVLETDSCSDAVLWNPWIDKSQRMVDFGDLEYLRMLCLEAGNVGAPVEVQPQEQWRCRQKLSVASVASVA